MKKISVITLHYIRNYGSVLQTYATQRKFELMGYNVEIIDYIRPKKDVDLRKGVNPLKKLLNKLLGLIQRPFHDKVFDDFLKKNIKLTRHYDDYNDLKTNPPLSDIYCVGSDQTWNSEYNQGILPAYYLDFGSENCKRVGYAVSIGLDAFPEKEIPQIKQYIQRFSAISVREASAKKIIEDIGYKNVFHVLDPTLVLKKEEWRNLIASRTIKGKYIIIYRLNKNQELENYAKSLSQKTGCKIVRMSYWLTQFLDSGKMIFTPTVNEFLSLIYYADYVITDSFHCTAFSLNFEKEFFVFYPGKFNTRIQSLLELTGTQDRVMGNGKNDYNTIDYANVRKILDRERKKVDNFISTYC